MPQQLICHSCQKELVLEEKVGRQDICPECDAYLRCCLNCRFYDPTAYNECREPQAERVVDKEQGNFCDYFELGAEAKGASNETEAAKKALEGLFKK
jgi:hypothetical protein